MEKVALLVSSFGDGGVERTFTNLASALAELGPKVVFLVGTPEHPYLDDLDMRVRCLPVGGDRRNALRTLLSEERPEVLITGKLNDDLAALTLRDGLGTPTRLVSAVGTLMSGRLASTRLNLLKRIRDRRRIRRVYRRLDGITGVSEHVLRDLCRHFGVCDVPMRALPNPIIPADVAERAAAPCGHPWLVDGQPPVIVAVGGLRQVKDFPTLLRAFARLIGERDVRLLVIGEGKERPRLESLAARLGVADRVDLHGFTANPFAYIARCRVLALTSRREGLGNVLVEAMAVGTPVVATDCTEGMRDLLRSGQLGSLVPVGDDRALADALRDRLDTPVDPEMLQRAAEPYGRLAAARGHLEFFESLVTH